MPRPKPPPELRERDTAAAIKVFRQIIRSPKTHARDKIRAQTELNKLLAVARPPATPSQGNPLAGIDVARLIEAQRQMLASGCEHCQFRAAVAPPVQVPDEEPPPVGPLDVLESLEEPAEPAEPWATSPEAAPAKPARPNGRRLRWGPPSRMDMPGTL